MGRNDSFKSTETIIFMKAFKILVLLSSVVAGIALTSCGCCTGDASAPALRKLPNFNSVPVPFVIDYAK